MTTSESAIEIRDLHKSYRKFLSRKGTYAVRGLSLHIQPGEVWALIGPNGAGKTTTLHCLTGLFSPDQGDVRLFGLDPRKPEARKTLGFQSEIFYTYNYRTAAQTLRLYGGLTGLKGDALEKRIDEVLSIVGLADVKQAKAGSFSKGMNQRLGLAQSILHDPQLIIWDEPSSGLDPEGRRLVIDLLQEMKAKGKTILFSTHILNDIERVCDHVAILNQGKIITSNRMQALLAENEGKTLEDIYLKHIRGGQGV